MGGTFAGNAVSCAAACATIDVIKEEKLLENTNERGQQLRTALLNLKQKYLLAQVFQLTITIDMM